MAKWPRLQRRRPPRAPARQGSEPVTLPACAAACSAPHRLLCTQNYWGLKKAAQRRGDLTSHPTSYRIMVHHISHLIPLEDLAPSDDIYQGVDEDFRILLRSSLGFRNRFALWPVTERHLVALALTEVCCTMGKGKVRIDFRTSLDK